MKMKFTTRRQKKATITTSKQAVEQAIMAANEQVEQLMDGDVNNPQIQKLQESTDFLSSILKKTPQEMAQDGVSSIEEYFDDAIQPEIANRVKQEVSMITQQQGTQGSTVTALPTKQISPTAVPAMASAKKKADGSAFVSDRDEKGEAKAPEKLVVPRLATKDKKAAPAVAPTPVAAAPVAPNPAAAGTTANPTPIPPKGSFDIKSLSTEALAKTVKALVSIKEFEEDKSAQALIEALTAELKTRPIEQDESKSPAAAPAPGPAPAAAPAPALPVAASQKKKSFDEPSQAIVDLGGLNVAPEEPPQGDRGGVGADTGASDGGAAGGPSGGGFIASGKAASGNSGGAFVTDEDTGTVVEDGGRTQEIGEAHAKRDDNTGITLPATTLPIKLAVEMTTGKALKEAERFGSDLKRLYLDAKPLVSVNGTRSVREAVEAIFRAADLFNEATKTLSKQQQQEESEEAVTKIKAENKGKKSSFLGLSVAASE
jgi:hypothetical protein